MDYPPGRPVATASRSSHGLDGVNFFVAAVQTVLLQSLALVADHPHDGSRRIQSGGNPE
jgi:hypothetical protein